MLLILSLLVVMLIWFKIYRCNEGNVIYLVKNKAQIEPKEEGSSQCILAFVSEGELR